MKIKVTNLVKRKELVNRIGSVFHDLVIDDYEHVDDKVILYFYRPCFEKAERNNFLFFISRWDVLCVREKIQISPVKNIEEIDVAEHKTETTGDWFLHFDIENDKEKESLKMAWIGVLSHCTFDISEKTSMTIEETNKIDTTHRYFVSKSYVDRHIEFFDEVMSKLNK